MGTQSILTVRRWSGQACSDDDEESLAAQGDSFSSGNDEDISRREGVRVDQAVFTSVQSIAGSGYRVIAASNGLRPEERQEITQRCPSHANLLDDGPSAEALCAWTFRTGRYAIAWSRHAGLEHTARGGYRVHTHVAILGEEEYRRFEFHPLRAYSAMLESLDEPLLEARSGLPPLFLPTPSLSDGAWVSAIGIGCNREAVFGILDAALAGKAMVVTGLSSPFAVLDAVMAVLPMSLRPEQSLSIGLKFSPARPSRIVLLDGNCEDVHWMIRGQEVCWLNAQALPAPAPHDGEDWLSLTRKWWSDGRRRELCQLAARVDFEPTSAALNRIAAICQDADTAAACGASTLDRLAAWYSDFIPASQLEADLATPVLMAIGARQRR